MAARKKKKAARAKKPTVLKSVRVSAIVQRNYRTRLQKSNQQYKAIVDRKVDRLIAQIDALDRSKPDAFNKQVAKIQKSIGGLQRNLEAANKRSEKAVNQFVKASDKENMKRTLSSFGKKVDPKAAKVLLGEKQKTVNTRTARLGKKYVTSITSANRDYSDRMQSLLYDKLADPTAARNNGAKLRKRRNKAKSIVSRRIKNTVKNQSHQINATINRVRLAALGAKSYMWQTKEDNRVRHNHSSVNKKIFQWAKKPAETGSHHPGEDFGCRCRAVPVLDI